MENKPQINPKKIIILCNYNSTKDHSAAIIGYFNDNAIPENGIELSFFNYRRILIDGGKNYLFNPPGYPEFMSIKQVLSEDVDGVIVFVETSVGIFETDLEIINLITSENIPHVLFANRDDFGEFEMDTYVDGVLIIPTIAQEGIGINDGLKMLVKLIDQYEKETVPHENSAKETTKTQEIHETIKIHEIYEDKEYDNPAPSPSFKPEFYKVRFFFHPIELDNVKNSLAKFGFSNITTIDIKYQDHNGEKMETYRCSSYELKLPPKIETMMIIRKEEIEYVIQALEAVKNEDISEKLFISPVEDIIRIRTTERGENAID